MTILLLESIHPAAHALLAAHDRVVLAPSPEAGAASADDSVVAILTRGRGRIAAELIERLPALCAVARCGVGLDNIDVGAARRRGVYVVYAPGSTTNALAEHTLLLMLAAARRLYTLAEAVRDGRWSVRDQYLGGELRGRTLGIVGLGAIGRRVAELAGAFGMRVLYWSRSSTDARYVRRALPALLAESDIVSLHVALTAETKHLIGADQLGQMKPGAILINTARGALIDQHALRAVLAEERLGYFAADVLDGEPPAPDDPLLRSDRVLLTPHTAALTDQTYEAMCVSTARNVLTILRGETPEEGAIFRS